MIFRPAFASIVCALLAGRAYAQIEKPTESELDAAPKQFQALVHGKSKFITPINQGFSGKGNIRPPDAVPVVTIPNPSHDPRDFTGYWYDPDAPGGQLPGGGVPVPLADAPPGLVRTTKIDAERLCIVDLGPEPESGRIYQNKYKLTMVYNNQLRARRIYFAGHHTPNAPLTGNGDSIAHWEGNTLVVDTIALRGFISGLDATLEGGLHKILIASPHLHVVERITKSSDGSTLTDQETWTDPSVSAMPYHLTVKYQYIQDPLGYDFECEDVGDEFGLDYGSANSK